MDVEKEKPIRRKVILSFVTKVRENSERIWLTIYADLMTNLMLFFLMLFAVTRLSVDQRSEIFSVIENEFSEEIVDAFEGGKSGKGDKEDGDGKGGKGDDGGKGDESGAGDEADGSEEEGLGGEGEKGEKGGKDGMDEDEKDGNTREQLRRREEELAAKMIQVMGNKGMDEDAQIKISEQKIRILLKSPVLFALGGAELKSSSHRVLHEVAELIRGVPNRIVVEGHTDNLPISNDEFQSNWELSAARAFSVTRYFIEKKNLNPKRLAGLGYGEYRPIMPNDTAENRSRNRRVEINIIRVSH